MCLPPTPLSSSKFNPPLQVKVQSCPTPLSSSKFNPPLQVNFQSCPKWQGLARRMLKMVSLAEGDGPMLPPGYVVYFTHLDNYNCAIERECQFVTLFTNVTVVLSACYPSSPPPPRPPNKWRETKLLQHCDAFCRIAPQNPEDVLEMGGPWSAGHYYEIPKAALWSSAVKKRLHLFHLLFCHGATVQVSCDWLKFEAAVLGWSILCAFLGTGEQNVVDCNLWSLHTLIIPLVYVYMFIILVTEICLLCCEMMGCGWWIGSLAKCSTVPVSWGSWETFW